MLKVINVYQSIAYLVCLEVFIESFVNSFTKNLNLGRAFTSLLLIVLISYVIYSNISLLISKKRQLQFIKLNLWFNFFQIFYISLLGFTFYLLLGIQIMPYVQYIDRITFGVHTESFNSGTSLSYVQGNEISLGINLIPLITFIYLDRFSKKLRISPPEESAR